MIKKIRMKYSFLVCISFCSSLFAMQLSEPSHGTLQDIPGWCVHTVGGFRDYGRFPMYMNNKLDCDIIEHFSNRASFLLQRDGLKPYGVQYIIPYGQQGSHALIETYGCKPNMQILEKLYKETLDDLITGWQQIEWRDWRRYKHISYPLSLRSEDEWILIIKNTATENTDTLIGLLAQKLGVKNIWSDHCTDPEDDGDWPGPLRPMAYCWIKKDSFDEVIAALNLQCS